MRNEKRAYKCISTDIPYFIIEYAFRPLWTRREAAHLLLGLNPKVDGMEISPMACNRVSDLYYDLKAQNLPVAVVGKPFGKNKSPNKYHVDRVIEVAEKMGRGLSPDLVRARNAVKAPELCDARIIRALYGHVASLIWGIHSTLRIPDVAEALTALPAKIKEKYGVDMLPLQPDQIREHLKGRSPHGKGAPGKCVPRNVSINWRYIMERT